MAVYVLLDKMLRKVFPEEEILDQGPGGLSKWVATVL